MMKILWLRRWIHLYILLDILIYYIYSHSPSKKSRYRFTPPPLSTSDKNPFLDSEAEGDDVSEEHSELDEEDRPVDDKDVVDDDDQYDILDSFLI